MADNSQKLEVWNL